MKKTTLVTAIGLVIGGASLSANATLTSSSVLVFDSSIVGCLGDAGTYPNCSYGPTATGGSWFGFDGNGDYKITQPEKGIIYNSGDGTLSPKGAGIQIGATYVADGSHSGSIDGSESPAFDIWELLGSTGMHYLTSAITVVDDAVGGDPTVKALDFSGWTITWNGIAAINMGGDATNFGTTGLPGELNSGLALMTCSTASCSDSSTFTLDYQAQVPKGDPSMFGGIMFTTHLEGQVSSVPVPAAAWLFSSGLLGLLGVARRKKI